MRLLPVDPFAPQLETHKLKGKLSGSWACSAGYDLRILFDFVKAEKDKDDINVWIDHPNQVDRFYGGYGPGLYFTVESPDIARFAGQLQKELDGLGSYFPEINSISERSA